MADDEYKKIFAKNLKHYMVASGKNQMDLMRDLGLSSSTVSNWCTGSKLPRMDKVQMLADYFHILKSDLLEEKSPADNNTYYLNPETSKIAQEIYDNKELSLLFDAARDADPEDLQTVHSMLMALKRKERGQ
ncbi:helix-turn-helix domain-containing protein [Roseburia sp. AM59-24XD]|uniref:helix-turn-helix domain-containing protein n=1 Tax=Roseburia sp. AM59-24XD TaxID=2293138 RepID=UPI001FA9D60B|nr:helix-turn-helix domain-containing protein [Roseburia sp. AM59-24XD]